jgi:hypothetical protein
MRHKQTPWQRDRGILDRMQRVDELRYLHGWSVPRIAVELGVSHTTIERDLLHCDELYRERQGETVEAQRNAVIRRLEFVAAKGLEAYEWDKSCERAVLFGGDIDDAEMDERLRVIRDQKGSAQFRGNKAAALSVTEKAAMDIAKLQGLVVEKAALTDGDGNSLAELILKARSDADR